MTALSDASAHAPQQDDPARVSRGRRFAWLGSVPFFLYTGIFLLLPTLLVVIGAFRDRNGNFSLAGINLVFSQQTLQIFWTTTYLSLITAAIGAVVGALASYALATSPEGSVLRRVYTALCSVLAQFGGVMLAFAFIALIGRNGTLSRLMRDVFETQIPGGFLSSVPGLVLVYCYFQIPLMVIVFLPALDGLRPQWREANESFGGGTWTYWTKIAGPLLAPSFFGSFLLLFANAFSAYATAAALISQQNIIVPMAIEGALRNENNPGMDSYAQALALGMIVVVAIVMIAYALLQKRTSRWLGA
ncbi:ABC transporter permease [Neomicrococcus aestuarii]|uniref:ABC transporter permease n=1 Tax=Neomicrococcus aestuarii TaxID=556325 RepID=A0A1L2ZPJ4_9MICC|nr:ABC transporter permease subunit [Neomicrococcus aestuarii]APF40948.1 ABC transporter permease [Neomicrococcus aestuarii]